MNNFDIPQKVQERFWAKVSKQDNGCWLWTGKMTPSVPRFYFEGKFVAAHRWLYELIHGEIPEKVFVHRRCQEIRCVNPDHLYLEVNSKGRSAEERFWEKVDKSEDCWNWTGKKLKREACNYGRFLLNGRWMPAHRYAYQLAHGEIPEGLVVRHHCDNPLCVRIEHLALGTQADNVADMFERKRDNHAKGERVNTARLTENDVRAIRSVYQPRQASSLARRYGVAVQTILYIVHKETWKHIE